MRSDFVLSDRHLKVCELVERVDIRVGDHIAYILHEILFMRMLLAQWVSLLVTLENDLYLLTVECGNDNRVLQRRIIVPIYSRIADKQSWKKWQLTGSHLRHYYHRIGWSTISLSFGVIFGHYFGALFFFPNLSKSHNMCRKF